MSLYDDFITLFHFLINGVLRENLFGISDLNENTNPGKDKYADQSYITDIPRMVPQIHIYSSILPNQYSSSSAKNPYYFIVQSYLTSIPRLVPQIHIYTSTLPYRYSLSGAPNPYL